MKLVPLLVAAILGGIPHRQAAAEKPGHGALAYRASKALSPIITNNITYIAPKANAAWWGEVDFACYSKVISLDGTRRPSQPFENFSPNIVPAMQVAGVDIGRDIAGVGAFECKGSACMYFAVHLQAPEMVRAALQTLTPTARVADLGNGHYTTTIPVANNVRTIHVLVVPIEWGDKAPTDPWSGDKVPTDPWSNGAPRATHVVLFGGVNGKAAKLDLMSFVADAALGAAKVAEVEATMADTHNRCVIGALGSRDFVPGFKLEKAGFAIVAPDRIDTPDHPDEDPLMGILGSRRTIDAEIKLTLTPTPSASDAARWVRQGELWLSDLVGKVRSTFAGMDTVTPYLDMISLLCTKAFRYDLKGNTLTLSWRTNRIRALDLSQLGKDITTGGQAGGI